MSSYRLTTDKPWHETWRDLAETMRKWRVDRWQVLADRAGRKAETWSQSEGERTVALDFELRGRPVYLEMGRQARAVDNLRVLYLAVEAMRLNEARGISEVVQNAYAQLAAPQRQRDPWELLELRPGASRETIDAVYRSKAKQLHPDAGGDPEEFKALQEAYEAVTS
jgi:hypothetical protein